MTAAEPVAAPVSVVVADGVAELTIDRAERRNALTGPVVEGLIEALESTRSDTGAILLRGAGRHLCAGLDLDAFGESPPPPWRAGFGERWAELHVALWQDDRPLVVAHRGGAVGAGSALLFAADVAISEPGAFAHVIEVAHGMLAPVNLAWLLWRHSPAVAGELALLAERMPSDELLRRGLVTEVVDDDTLDERARDRARRLASLPAAAVAATRAARRHAAGTDLPTLIESIRAHADGLAGPPRR